MNISFSIEAEGWQQLPEAEVLAKAAMAATLPGELRSIDVLLTDDADIQQLNAQWRGKDKATNVLSFPSPAMPVPAGEVAHMGDLVFSFETIEREAQEQKKQFAHHFVHLVVHGCLHLAGFDHETDADAAVMEEREKNILAGLGIADPYLT